MRAISAAPYARDKCARADRWRQSGSACGRFKHCAQAAADALPGDICIASYMKPRSSCAGAAPPRPQTSVYSTATPHARYAAPPPSAAPTPAPAPLLALPARARSLAFVSSSSSTRNARTLRRSCTTECCFRSRIWEGAMSHDGAGDVGALPAHNSSGGSRTNAAGTQRAAGCSAAPARAQTHLLQLPHVLVRVKVRLCLPLHVPQQLAFPRQQRLVLLRTTHVSASAHGVELQAAHAGSRRKQQTCAAGASGEYSDGGSGGRGNERAALTSMATPCASSSSSSESSSRCTCTYVRTDNV